MSETKNLKLFKHDEPLETNENKFDIDLALNQNWDKIDKFADTVDNKVTNLQEQNTKLQAQIKKDRENMINLEVEGQSIHIEDSSDLEGQLEVLGNVEQDVREGYNLYDYMSRVIATTKGLNVTKDTENGYLIVNGTPETDYTSITAGTNITDKIKDKTTYSLWQEKYDGKLFLQVNAKKKDDSGYDYFSVTSTKKDFTVDKSKYGDYTMVIQTGLKTQAGTFNNYKNRYMLYEGTEEKPYEPYGASPSPEYPSTVRAVGDNINLWDKENMLVELGGYSGSNGNKYDSTTRIRNTKDIELKKDTYTLSAENSKLISIYIVDLKKELSSNGDSVTFTLEKDNTIRFTIENTALLNTEIKLERGNKKTGYSPYGQGSVEIKKTTANYYNVEDYNGNLNSHITIDENNWITASGKNTEESVTYLNHFTNNLDLIVGKKYWIVAEIKSVSGEGNFNITSASKGSGQFNGRAMQLTDLKIGQKVIFQETAINSAGQGLRTFISLQPGQTCNITFRLSVLETDPNKSNWKYVPYKKETYVLPIQKPMLEGDYFVKEADGWKEVHTWKEFTLNGKEYWKQSSVENTVFFLNITNTTQDRTKFKIIANSYKYGGIILESSKAQDGYIYGFVSNSILAKRILLRNNLYTNLESFKKALENNVLEVYAKAEMSTKLPCTPEQTKILDELDNFSTYKLVTNITTDSIAKLRLKYIADTKRYIDNKTSNLEQQVNTINQLLSTTKTSSVLLDNLQSDIESEVL